jgi:ankyrin repeat protein
MTDLDKSLFEAAREGRADEVARLIAQGADVNARHPKYCDHGAFLDGFTPLMWAAASPRSNAQTVKALLDAGADLFAVSNGEVSALWYASGGGSGYPLTPENLMELEESHPYRDWGGGDVERLQLILDAGADPNEAADNGRTAVGEAARVGDPFRLKLLIERGASVQPREAKKRRKHKIERDYEKLLKQFQEDFDANGKFEAYAVPLFQAAALGNAECVRLILEAGFPADFVCDGENALDHVGSVEAAQMLWDAGCRVGKGRFGFDAVDDAFEGERYVVAQFLIDQMDEPHRSHFINEKLMTCSGTRMNPDGVRALLSMGADPNYMSKDLGTPLHWCCWQGDGNCGRDNEVVVQTLELLLSAGSDVNAIGERGYTPLHYAVAGDWGSPTAVRVLLTHGAQVDARNANKKTPLMQAAKRGDVESIELLLAAGADRSLKDRRGKSAVIYAREHLKVWQGIVRKPPRIFSKLMSKFGMDSDAMAGSHEKALKSAEEAVRLLSSI